MNDELESVVQYTAPDDWASDDARRGMTQAQAAQDIADSVAIFLALGGKITKVPIGASAAYNPLVASVPFYNTDSKLTHPAVSRDQDMSKQVQHWINVNPSITFKEMSDAMKLRSSTLSRVIKTHFGHTEKGKELLSQYGARGLSREEFAAQAIANGKKGTAALKRNAANRAADGIRRIRYLLEQNPRMSLADICKEVDTGEATVRRWLREGFEGHPHVQWLLADKRKRENHEVA